MSDIVERLGVLAASLANPQVAVEAQRETERLRAERDTFYMDYRIKCDEETKRLEAELAAAKALLRETADAADDVGVKHFDTDWLSDEVQRLKNITLSIRAALGDEP